MKTPLFRVLLIVLVCLTFTALARAQTAIFYASDTTVRVRVNLAPKINPTAQPSAGGLYSIDDNGNWTQLAPLPSIPSPYTQFEIKIPRTQYNPKHKYQVVVFGIFKNADDVTIQPSQSLVVTLPLVLSIVRDKVNCPDGFTLLAKAQVADYNWDPYYEWLRPFETSPNGIATIMFGASGGSDQVNVTAKQVSIITSESTARVTGNSRTCILTEPGIPNVTFKATVNLNEINLPADIAGQASAAGLSPTYTVSFPKREDFKEDTSKRILERNLDLGVSMTSSVADEEVAATASTPKSIVRKRTTRGVLDVRFAPWIDILQPVIRENKLLHFLTPFYLNANVATGKITKDTLALNRILFGFEGELRYYTSRRWEDENGNNRHSNPIWHRLKYGAQHASDRDFKQDEFTGKIEYAPIFEALYNPYKFNFTGNTGEKIQTWYGYAFQPRMGFEIGRTYHRENPAAVIKPSANVRRFYFGGDLGFDLTGHTSFSVTDVFYVRGEVPENRTQNYFKGSFDLLFRRGDVTSSGVFLSFERGQLPPFATPPANVFKVGFRIVSNYCKDACR
jgi:hypothetical protein